MFLFTGVRRYLLLQTQMRRHFRWYSTLLPDTETEFSIPHESAPRTSILAGSNSASSDVDGGGDESFARKMSVFSALLATFAPLCEKQQVSE